MPMRTRVLLIAAALLLAVPLVPAATQDVAACTQVYPFSELCGPDKVDAVKCIVEAELGVGECGS